MTAHDALLARFPFPAVIDNTMRQAWWTCPHLFFRQHVQGLRRRDRDSDGNVIATKSIHLHFGGALARGLEVTRRAHFHGASELQAVTAGAEALIKEWGSHELPAPSNRNEANKTLASCLLAHDGYFRYFDLADPQHRLGECDGKPLVEVSGALPIPGVLHPVTGEPLLYAGRFDAICSRHNKLWGLDDKSTGSNVDSESWRSQWKLSGQFTGYAWLARAWGFSLDGFLVHGIQVLTETTRYAEAITPRPQWLIDEWVAQLREDVKTMIEQYTVFIGGGNKKLFSLPHPFGRAYGSACHAYNRPCSYLDDLCAQPNPEDWVSSAFTVERWNPLERNVAE